MTGIEPAAIAGAAKAIGKATEEDPKEKEQLLKIAESTGALDPAAKTAAKRVALKQHIRLKLWQPLGMLFGVSSQYFASDFENELADRLEDVPEDEVVTPPMNVAGPAIQGISFTVDQPNLRAMYLNLLATASDRRVQDAAHPSFAEVIRQLGAEEAGWLGSVLYHVQEPIVEIHLRARVTAEQPNGDGYKVLATNLLDWLNNDGEHFYKPEHALWVDNWQRLGLVKVDMASHLAREDAYAWVESNPLYVAMQERYDTPVLKHVKYEKGILRATEFGRSFFAVVVVPPAQRAIEACEDPSPS
jgi:hypothetical protein